jgi:hypothetical protein
MAFYPSQVPLHYVSRYIKPGMDPFGDLLAGCRKLGMSVIARTDPHAAHDEIYRRTPTGLPSMRRQEAAPLGFPGSLGELRVGPLQLRVHDGRHRGDRPQVRCRRHLHEPLGGLGTCYCEHCTANFKKATGFDIPATPRPPQVKHAYDEWKEDRLFEQWHLWDKTIRKHRPNARFIANSGGGALSRIDMVRPGQAVVHPLRRPAGAERRHADVDQRQVRERVPGHDGSKPVAASSALAWKLPIAGRIPSRTRRNSGHS